MILKKNPTERFIALTLLLVAGAMLTVSALQLIPSAFRSGAPSWQVVASVGVGFALVVILSSIKLNKEKSDARSSALIVTLALSLHNLPEGAAPIGATLLDFETGLITTLVIALHNIPEGIAITATALIAGYSRRVTLLLTAAAALSEGFGAWIIYLNGSLFLDQVSIGLLLASVAGIMIAICLRELIPYSNRALRKSN